MVFHWSLSDHNFPLSILADLSNVVVKMVSACPLISKSSGPLIKHLGIILSRLITIGITITLMFYSWILVSLWFLLCGPPGQQSPLYGRFSLSGQLIIYWCIQISVIIWGYNSLNVDYNSQHLSYCNLRPFYILWDNGLVDISIDLCLVTWWSWV